MRQRILLTFFFLIVLIPALILSVLAVRAVNQEETIQRRKLEETLFSELDQTNTIVLFTLNQLLQELRETIPAEALDNPKGAARKWKGDSLLPETLYVLNPDGTILFPDINDQSLDSEELNRVNLFFWRYLNLFSNRESIPIYRSIASEFEEDILELTYSAEDQESPGVAENKSEEFAKESPAESTAEFSLGAGAAPLYDRPSSRSKSAQDVFETDRAVQERVYRIAEEEGLLSLQRNVMPQNIAGEMRESLPVAEVRSVFIESTRYFNEITSESEYGLIPRIFDNSFILLYWEKRGATITGCELDMARVKEKLAESIPVPENSLRYVNILDHSGTPIIPFVNFPEENWRKPFVAKEISALLPYWETAILLRDPEDLERRIESSRYYLSFLIFLLCLFIFAGTLSLYQFYSARLREVKQRVGFVTNVSHELKTPLTSIRLYSEMLSQGYQKDPEKIGKYSSYIASESQRLTRLINNVLVFAKLEKGTGGLNLETAELNEIVSGLMETVGEELEREGFSVKIILWPEPLKILADKEAVIQVLLNLVSNARKYGGTEKLIEIKTMLKSEAPVLEISDRGIGIPRKYRNKIFREFFRIDNSVTAETAGTGLGLAIARKLMRRQGGDIEFAPISPADYSLGSVFTVRFNILKRKKPGIRDD